MTRLIKKSGISTILRGHIFFILGAPGAALKANYYNSLVAAGLGGYLVFQVACAKKDQL